MPTRFTVSLEENPRSPFWYARVYFEGQGGKSKRFSTGVAVGNDRRISARVAARTAEQRATDLAAALEGQELADADQALKAVGRRMLAQKRADKRRDLAISALAFNLDKHVLPYFGAHRDVTTFRRADLEAFKRHMSTVERKVRAAGKTIVVHGYEATTINNALTAIRQVLKYACNIEETIEFVPHVANVFVDKQGKGRALTPAQVVALLAGYDPRAGEAREFLLYVANTGVRKSEALALRWEWINWETREISTPAQYRKGGKPQRTPTPINDVVDELLRDRLARPAQPSLGRVWFQKKHDGARNSAAARAGLGRVRNHDLRHTLGSLHFASGASAPELRDLLGHETMAMVSRYGHSYPERLQAAAQRVQLGGKSATDSATGEPAKKSGNARKRDRGSERAATITPIKAKR